MNDTKEKLSLFTISLHWIVAVGMIALVVIGIYMAEFEVYALYDWHKAFGVLLFVAALARVLWRMKKGWPKAAGDYSVMETITAKGVHWLLIIATLLMPISGLMMSGFGGHGVDVFGWQMIADNPSATAEFGVAPINETFAGVGHQIHNLLGWALLVIIVLHVAGAVKHHVVDKDATLLRMLGK